ncbi:ester cyclase [Flavobacteriaceae bacterium]|jgi:steroid delta-isomerase-like uncharacterized protein|nr:ester cyclase [Flavobacteriaceae bacterium]MDA9037180.1 ester cyclase [Flavobacteriaceae bacterium]MDA9588317.1 ester cyclase [Flavobacteriaceae bacterium]
MKNIFFISLGILFLGCSQAPRENQNQLSEQIQIDVKMYSELWDKFLSGDTNAINNSTFTEDVVVVTEQGNIVGIDAVKEFYLNYLEGFSEIEFQIIDAFGRGDKLIKHYNFKGKHTGTFMGIPATGNYLNLSGTTIVTMREGRIAKEQDFFNMKSLLDQLQNSKGEVTVDEYQPIN